MKTILYVGAFKLPDLNAAAMRVMNNAKAFRELGYNVVLIGTSLSQKGNITKTKNIIDGFDNYSVNNNGVQKLNYGLSIKYIKQIHSIYKETKIIIAYNYPSIALEFLRRYCLKMGIKLIADCTEWGMNSLNVIRNIDVKLRMEYVQPKCDGVIAISEYMYKHYNKKTNTLLLPPLTDIKSTGLTMQGLDRLVFTYAGNPGSKKDQLGLFLQAFAETKADVDYTINIVGISKEAFLKKNPSVGEFIDRLGEKIDFVGRQNHDDTVEYLKQSTFVFFIREANRSNMAGFPTKYAEAVSCGVPVITNLTSDISKYLIDAENGFIIEECDIDSIKEVLARIFNSKKVCLEKIKSNCRQNTDIFRYNMYIPRIEEYIRIINK